MASNGNSSTLLILTVLLRPIVRLCLKHSLKFHDLLAALKVAFVEEAQAEFAETGEKSNVSRISAATGIHRQDVTKLLEADTDSGSVPAFNYPLDVVSRILSEWQTNKHYLTPAGQPRVLTVGGRDALFPRLVSSISTGMNPSTILFEMERSGAVKKEGNTVRLERAAFTPSHDAVQGFRIVARDIADLVKAADENIDPPSELKIKNLHARTEFDNIRPEGVDKIRAWLMTEGHKLHRATREFLAQYDQDTSPDPLFKGDGIRVSLGTFALVDATPHHRPVTTKIRRAR